MMIADTKDTDQTESQADLENGRHIYSIYRRYHADSHTNTRWAHLTLKHVGERGDTVFLRNSDYAFINCCLQNRDAICFAT